MNDVSLTIPLFFSACSSTRSVVRNRAQFHFLISGTALDDLNLELMESSKSRKSSGFSCSEIQLLQQHHQQQSKSRNCSGGSSISQGLVSAGILHQQLQLQQQQQQQQSNGSNPVMIPGSNCPNSGNNSGKLTPPGQNGDQHGHENVSSGRLHIALICLFLHHLWLCIYRLLWA